MTFLPLQEWLNRSKKKKEKKRLRKVSRKRAKEIAIYSALAKDFKKAHPVCQVCRHNRTKDVHHKEGRGPNLNNVATFIAVCRGCHKYIHDNPSWARERGYLK